MKEIEATLDQEHAKAKAAFAAKDLAEYRSLFSGDLTYVQANGRTIDREQLLRDVAAQFLRFSKVESSFVRESIEERDGGVIELLSQSAVADESLFVFFRRRWTLERRGRYTWTRAESGWVISRVEVLEEKVR